MKKVLIVNSSPREEGNCTTFSVHLKKKLDDSTIPCKLINLKDYTSNFVQVALSAMKLENVYSMMIIQIL